MRKIVFFICAAFLCSALSWGQKWNLSPTMTAEFTSKELLVISTTAAKDAMPDFTLSTTGDDTIKQTLSVVILILSIMLLIIRLTKKKGEPRQGTIYFISTGLFLTVCALEILHVVVWKDLGIPWFCDPNMVGWMWTVINFFLLGGLIVNQVLYLFDVIDDVFKNGNAMCDLRLGLYSWIGGFVCAFLFAIFFKAGVTYVYYALGLMQIIQSVLIFKSYNGNMKGALLGISVYLLGTTGTVLTFMTFFAMLIIIVIGVATLWLILKLTGIGGQTGGIKGRIVYPNGSSEEATGEKGAVGETIWTGKDSGNHTTTTY